MSRPFPYLSIWSASCQPIGKYWGQSDQTRARVPRIDCRSDRRYAGRVTRPDQKGKTMFEGCELQRAGGSWNVDGVSVDEADVYLHGVAVGVVWRRRGVMRRCVSVFTPRQIDREGGKNFHDFTMQPLAAPAHPLAMQARMRRLASHMVWHAAGRAETTATD